MGRADDFYARLPVLGQHAAVSAFGASWAWARFGPGYRHHLARFRAHDYWSEAEWELYRHKAVTDFASRAVAKVPYYRRTYLTAEKEAAREGRLQDLPLLGKSPLRRDPEEFVDPTLRPRRPRIFLTSGSSGTPVATYWSSQELRASMAVREARSAQWAGVSFRLPRATFSGRMVEPDPKSQGPFYRFNAVERQVYLSPFHLRPDTAGAYAHALRRHNVQWATGYAVSFALLADFILTQNVRPLSLRAVITTSEKLTETMRQKISAAFGCRVYEEYSSVENVFFASECPAGSLHASPDAGIIEILDHDGSPATPGVVGEVVVTGLLRQVQPLIRYRIGDLAAWGAEACPCGRGMPVIADVSGRVEDVVVGPDGRQLVRFHGVFVGLPQVSEAQVIQEAPDRFRILVVAEEGFDNDVEAEMRQRMRQRLGDVSVSVLLVDQIPRSASGKFQAVISELPN